VRRVTGLSFSGARFKGRRSVASLLVGCQKGNCLVSSFYSRLLAGRPQGTENKAFRVLQAGRKKRFSEQVDELARADVWRAVLQGLAENRKRNRGSPFDFAQARLSIAPLRSPGFPQALLPGRVPHVRGLSRTWVERIGEALLFLFPVSRCRPEVKALEKVVFNPCTRKSANMGHPSRERGLWKSGVAQWRDLLFLKQTLQF
jgi:hypothetical protein